MLESVVEYDHVDILTRGTISEPADGTCTFLIDSHRDIGELLLDLEGLITDVVHRRVVVGQHEPMTLPLVTATEYSKVRLVLQQADQVLHVRCLTCSAYGDVAHRDDGSGIGTALQDICLKEEVPKADP